jgi:hypothetical protein
MPDAFTDCWQQLSSGWYCCSLEQQERNREMEERRRVLDTQLRRDSRDNR